MTDQTNKLEPCPFCGGKAYIDQHGTRRQSCVISCHTCGCMLETNEEGANCGDQWNRRASAQGEQAALAAPAHPATAGDAVYDAIGILTEFADDLCSCHTITPDDWDDEPDAKAEYDRIIRCVAQLQAMRASKGGE